MDTNTPPTQTLAIAATASQTAHWTANENIDELDIVQLQFLAGIKQSLTQEEVLDYKAAVEYKGFDPKKIGKAIYNKTRDKRLMYSDINKMIVIAMTRGTVLIKIKRAVSEEGARMLDDLVSRYGLVSTGQLGTNREHAITLARVCACYPIKCIQVLLAGKLKPVDTVDEYHYALCFPAAAMIIPRHFTRMRELYKEWSLKFAKRTTRKGSVPSNEIAINLLDIGDDLHRCRLWNLASFLISQKENVVGAYTNGHHMVYPDRPLASMEAAVDMVNAENL